LKETALNSFIFDLQQILSTNHLDKSYDIIFSLLRNSEFCYQSLCYSLPIFSSMDKSLVAVSVQSTQQSLARGYFISCTILPNQRTSVYSHTMAIYENDRLHFKKEGLASVSFLDLKNPNIDSLSRPIQAEDKLVNLFYPIYNGVKVSLQCLKPIAIIVDEQNMWCNDISLQFIPFPQTITVNGKTILSVHLPQHFSMKMAEMTHDFEVMSQFRPLNNTAPGPVQKVISYFEVAQTIHWSLFTLVIISTICIVLLMCFTSYLKCPSVISRVLECCWNANCCLLRILSKRIREKEVVRGMQQESVQMLPTNRPAPQIEMVDLNQGRPVILPSAPNISVDTNVSHNMSQDVNVMPPMAANPPIIQQVNRSYCRSGYTSCFCLHRNQPCHGPVQPPPFN
jgi:hypothetical protein